MFQVAKFAAFALAVSALAVPRAVPPAGWSVGYLEDYDTYHTRYLALQCHDKHDTDFFELCCHPLLAAESLSTSRPAHWQCNPASTTVAAPMPHADDEDEDVVATSTQEIPSPKKVLATPELEPNAFEKTSSTVNTGGFATYYYQNGVAGACGKVHSDNELIGAIDVDRYGNPGAVSSECNKKAQITNTKNGKVVTVVIADACPTCTNGNSIDLSKAAFLKIATLDEGIVPIKWSYI